MAETSKIEWTDATWNPIDGEVRFNEFWQLEFQCIYATGTKADYRTALIDSLLPEVQRFTGGIVDVVPSDRLPPYSESTLDIEVDGREVASCSIRTDFLSDTRVCEIAFGLDRIVHFARAVNGGLIREC